MNKLLIHYSDPTLFLFQQRINTCTQNLMSIEVDFDQNLPLCLVNQAFVVSLHKGKIIDASHIVDMSFKNS